jgi:energy-coupling factor transporter transmembrane protein EcfT
MKIIKTILDRPYLLILIAAIITLVSPNKYFLYSIGIISVIFSISIIYSIVQKKWLRLAFSFLSYIVFFILWIVFVFFKGYSDDIKP